MLGQEYTIDPDYKEVEYLRDTLERTEEALEKVTRENKELRWALFKAHAALREIPPFLTMYVNNAKEKAI